jgi:LCP family protein required for cell wall assembly
MRGNRHRHAFVALTIAIAAALLPVTSLAGDAARTSATDPADSVSYGSDGRFTILLLGSDWRTGSPGERQDVVIVMTIDPVTKRVAAASIPRDTVYIPRAASNGGGTSGNVRINSMYGIFYRRTSFGHSQVDLPALVRLKNDVSRTLATEIDYVAMVRFSGFTYLIDRIGGVNVEIKKAITDTFLRTPGTTVRGAYFPVDSSYHLKGKALCGQKPKHCHNALMYVRSRHGTVGTGYNSDFARARRQHPFVVAAADKIVANGTSGLPGLVSSVQGRIWTNLPRTLSAATQLYHLVDGAHLRPADTQVFSPSTWATSDSSTPQYTFRLRLPKVRTWINDHFGS